jgi:hypothetical protein
MVRMVRLLLSLVPLKEPRGFVVEVLTPVETVRRIKR